MTASASSASISIPCSFAAIAIALGPRPYAMPKITDLATILMCFLPIAANPLLVGGHVSLNAKQAT